MRVLALATYRQLFQDSFPAERGTITAHEVVTALAAFQVRS